MTWLRETPYSLCYDPYLETGKDIQGNDLGHRKNAKDWAIRRRVPTAVLSDSMNHKPLLTERVIGHGTVSETAKASVSNEGLISPRMLKVQSVPPTKEGEHHGVVNYCPCFFPLSINGSGTCVYATKCHSKICGKFAYRLD